MNCESCSKPIGRGKGEGLEINGTIHYAHYGKCFWIMKWKNYILHDSRYMKNYSYKTFDGIYGLINDIRCSCLSKTEIKKRNKETREIERMEVWFRRLTRRQKHKIYLENRKKIRLRKVYYDADDGW